MLAGHTLTLEAEKKLRICGDREGSQGMFLYSIRFHQYTCGCVQEEADNFQRVRVKYKTKRQPAKRKGTFIFPAMPGCLVFIT